MGEIRNIVEFRREVEWLVNDIKYSDEGIESENFNAAIFISFMDIAGFDSNAAFDTPEAKKAFEVLSKYKLPLADMLSHTKYMFVKDNCMEILDEIALVGSKENNDIIQPRELTQLMLSLADIKETDKVYNPFSGIGSFALALPSHSILAEEVNETCWAMSTLYLLAKGAKTKPLCRNSFKIAEVGENSFDKIIFHPEFFDKGKEARATALFMKKVLKDNGRLVCILPSYLMYATNGFYSGLRAYLEVSEYQTTVYALPSSILSPSTSVSSCILVVDKIKSKNLTVVDARTFYKSIGLKKVLDLESFADTKAFEYHINWDKCDYDNIEPAMLEARKQFADMPIVRLDEIFDVYGENDAKQNEYYDETNSYEHDCIWSLTQWDASDDPFNCEVNIKQYEGDDADKYFEDLSGDLLGLCICHDKVKIADLKIDFVHDIKYDNRDSFIMEWYGREDVDHDYIKCILTSDFVYQQLKPIIVEHKWGLKNRFEHTFISVDISDIKGLMIPLPDLDEQRKYVINEMRRRIEANKQEQKKAFENYEKEIHCRKHALSQTVSGLNSLWQILSSYKDKNEGRTIDTDFVGKKSKMQIADIWKKIGGDISMICQQVEHLADENHDWGEEEDIDLKAFISDYQQSHAIDKFKFAQTEFNVDQYNPLKPFRIPKKALTQVLDNILSNAVQHGFSSDGRNDYEVKFVVNAEEKSGSIHIFNNGEPLSEGIDTDSLFQYGYSTALNEASSKDDNHVHSGIGLYEVKNILSRYGAEVNMNGIAGGEKYTVETIIKF